MNLNMIKDQAQRFVSDNATTILTAVGVVGTVGTAVLAGKASFKASTVIRNEQKDRLMAVQEENVLKEPEDIPFDTLDKVKLVWPLFVPPMITGTVTVGSIIMAHRMNAQKAAALAAAYGLAEGRLKEYQNKVAEKLTGPKNQAIHDEIAQERVTENPPDAQVLILSGADVLCYDMYTGRYFQSTMEGIKQAMNAVNGELYHHQYASLSFFFEKIGLEPTSFSDEVGWNQATTGAMDLRFSTAMSPEQKPCLAIDFIVPPQPEYKQLY